jgi:hypothetical protein
MTDYRLLATCYGTLVLDAGTRKRRQRIGHTGGLLARGAACSGVWAVAGWWREAGRQERTGRR